MGYRKLAKSSPDYSGNEFSVVNSLWFVVASLLQQGPDQTPRSIAGRTLSTSFWFFVTIVMAAYISSLAAYFICKYASFLQEPDNSFLDSMFILFDCFRFKCY